MPTGTVADCQAALHDGAHLDAEDVEGNTALHLAVQANNLDTTRFLLDSGATNLGRKNHRLGHAIMGSCDTPHTQVQTQTQILSFLLLFTYAHKLELMLRLFRT